MRYQIKSQLYTDAESQLKGAKQILDDCTWSSCAAAVAWSSQYELNPSAADGVAAQRAVTKRVDVQGKSDNGGSLPEAVKVVAKLGGKARYAKSWGDAVAAAKAGDALLIWTQQPVGYPPELKISAWHTRWHKWWGKQKPEKIKLGYGHMVSAGWCQDHGWQFACPTRDERTAAEKYAVPVTEEQLLKIASSKVKAGKLKVVHKAILIVTFARARVEAAAAPETAPEPKRGVQLPAASTSPVPAPKPPSVAQKPLVAAPSVTAAAEAELAKVDWAGAVDRALSAVGKATKATRKERGMKRVWAILRNIAKNTQLDEMLLDLTRTFVTVSISVALGLGIPLLDLQGADFRVILSAGLASAAQVVVKFLDPNNTSYGVTKLKP